MNIKNILLFITSYLRLIIFDLELHTMGFNRIFKKYSKKFFMESGVIISDINRSKVIRDLYYLELVCAWYPRKADCIHKTLIGYKILSEKYKLKLEMVVGLNKFPFEAHAWLRYQGKSLIDEDDDINYKVFLSSNKFVGID